jgi:prepilin-type N-terminal cleavage/methylation domain-containing protein
MEKRGILSRRRAAVPRAGMTLIECMVALVILSGSLLALGNFMGKYAHTTTMAAATSTAIDLATNRIDSIRTAPTYATIPTTYAGVQTIAVGPANYKRITTINHIGGSPTDTMDVMVVTVTVAAPDSGATVKKTAVIGFF